MAQAAETDTGTQQRGDGRVMAQEGHGHTPAAWTAVAIMIVGFTVGAIAVVTAVPWLVAAGVGIVVAGAVAGKVMQLMGLGQPPVYTQDEAERRAGAEPGTAA
jgi:hypothetical protein